MRHLEKKHSRYPTTLIRFAGAGGCSLGFQQAGVDVRFATDLGQDAVESYRRNFDETPEKVRPLNELFSDSTLPVAI
jgi:DNA (cytosine-5)-methyltransferase 1